MDRPACPIPPARTSGCVLPSDDLGQQCTGDGICAVLCSGGVCALGGALVRRRTHVAVHAPPGPRGAPPGRRGRLRVGGPNCGRAHSCSAQRPRRRDRTRLLHRELAQGGVVASLRPLQRYVAREPRQQTRRAASGSRRRGGRALLRLAEDARGNGLAPKRRLSGGGEGVRSLATDRADSGRRAPVGGGGTCGGALAQQRVAHRSGEPSAGAGPCQHGEAGVGGDRPGGATIHGGLFVDGGGWRGVEHDGRDGGHWVTWNVDSGPGVVYIPHVQRRVHVPDVLARHRCPQCQCVSCR
mmetsp:Transcript_22535/g.42996  ORF Transcript_22535/g.42996 Transcript_22535/m.42996 type:complete len:297 (-) Transcript_22535:1067-1957(-)